MEDLVYLNGKLLPASQAKLSPFDLGFLYGFGLFETMRAYSGRVFRLAQHIDRLTRSAELLALWDKLAKYDLARAIRDTIQANNLSDGRVRLTVSAGPGEMVPDPRQSGEPTVLVIAKPYTPLSTQVYERGYSAYISPLRRDSSSMFSNMKSSSNISGAFAWKKAKLDGFDEALLLNEKGQLAEGSVSNIFVVYENAVLTPTVESGILPGIAREAILEIIPSLGVSVAGKRLMPDDLFRADEAFLTNSVIEVMPLTEVDNRPIGSGHPGPITRKLMSVYKDLVHTEIKANQD